jgi:hypothetical protein
MQPYGLKYGAHVCEGKLCCGGPNDKLKIKHRERQKGKRDAKTDYVSDALFDDDLTGFGVEEAEDREALLVKFPQA